MQGHLNVKLGHPVAPGVINKETWFFMLGIGRGTDNLCPKKIICLETFTEIYFTMVKLWRNMNKNNF